MKITIDIDCTPQEARAFLGLPNIEPMQDQLIAQMQEQLTSYLATMDPEALLKTWLPASIKGLGQIQERFWGEFMAGMAGGDKGQKDDKTR